MSELFETVFGRLRAIMLAAAPEFVVSKDLPGSLELRRHEIDLKTKQPGWFGTVTMKKTYVAVHLMPLYVSPHLAENCSPELTKRKQGKTCFNFTREDDKLFDELDGLIRSCAKG